MILQPKQSQRKESNTPTFYKNLPTGAEFPDYIYVGDLGSEPQFVHVNDFIHGLVIGQGGSGKTEFLMSLIANTHKFNVCNGLKWTIVSSQPSDVEKVKKLSELLNLSSSSHDKGTFEQVMNDLFNEYQSRRELFKTHQVRDIDEYRLKVGKLDRQYLIVDSWNDIYSGNLDDFETEQSLKQLQILLSSSRAFGFTIILCSRRYMHNGPIPTIISRNLPSIIVKSCDSVSDMILSLDNKGQGLERNELLFKNPDYELTKFAFKQIGDS